MPLVAPSLFDGLAVEHARKEAAAEVPHTHTHNFTRGHCPCTVFAATHYQHFNGLQMKQFLWENLF